MVGCHYRHNTHEFEQALGIGDGQGGLVCCSPWGRRESDTTEGLNRTELHLQESTLLLATCAQNNQLSPQVCTLTEGHLTGEEASSRL